MREKQCWLPLLCCKKEALLLGHNEKCFIIKKFGAFRATSCERSWWEMLACKKHRGAVDSSLLLNPLYPTSTVVQWEAINWKLGERLSAKMGQ